jgi:hypothetical protein
VGRRRLAGERVLKLVDRRAGLVVCALLLLALGASVIVTASTSRRADATCNGAGQPFVLSNYDGNGTLVAQESATYPGTTCNNDAQYSGAILDPISDGSCANTYYLEPFAYYALQGSSCTTGAWSFYSYNDTNGPNSVFVSVRPSYLADAWRLSSGY